ncbi:hypothetical protein [Mycoplasma sp. P36-A1]|uniref:hypothetical protein n=1 Tax=Mycoplasma sp. P36-A1 TaxID=3252900 RepID=UPI003C2D9185
MASKKIVVVLDGVSENIYPTTLQLAKTPNLDYLVSKSECYKTEFVYKTQSVASDVANMNILGYDSLKYYHGRAGIEAWTIKKPINDKNIYRMNFVTVENDILKDFSSEIINDEQGQVIFDIIQDKIKNIDIAFIEKYHHLLFDTNKEILKLEPPHEIMNQNIKNIFEIEHPLIDLMKESKELLKDQQSNMIYIWGASIKNSLPDFLETNKLKGAMISATPLVKGLGLMCNLDILDVVNINGTHKSNFHGKIETTLKALNKYDYVFLHIEALDYVSHLGDKELKIATLEIIDNSLKPLLALENVDILVTSDHHALTQTKAHERGNVPAFIYNSTNKVNNDISFDEKQFSKLPFTTAKQLIKKFLKR